MESFVRRRNISRFEGLLRSESDPATRAMLLAILNRWQAEEEGRAGEVRHAPGGESTA